jgi:ABC-type ATPase with predicted acetyltransferase domain
MFALDAAGAEVLYDDLELTIALGEIVAVVGPSGAGKSVLLKQVARKARRRKDVCYVDADDLRTCSRPAIAAVGEGCLQRRLAVLSRCGLAEAAVLVAPARCLSGGQLYRLALARAILQSERNGRGTLLVADEFASGLDWTTAWVLCRQLRKCVSGWRRENTAWVRQPDRPGAELAALLATSRSELLGALEPDRVIFKPLGNKAVQRAIDRRFWLERDSPGILSAIERGSIADYRHLAQFHYVAGEPAAHKRVWVIRRLDSPWGGIDGDSVLGPTVSPAAVLVVSPPVGLCRGRNAALPGRYTGRRMRPALERLNREIECISRVVVHPIFRGLGLAVALVRHALATAETPMVESLAAMGEIHPLFEKAGMYSFGAFDGSRRYVYFLGQRMPYAVGLPHALPRQAPEQLPQPERKAECL